MPKYNSLNRRQFLATALAGAATLAAPRRRLALPTTILGVRVIRYPLPIGRQAKIATIMGQSCVVLNPQLGPAAAVLVMARGVFFALRDRPTVAAIEANGFYWNGDEDDEALAVRAARHGMVMSRWGASA